MSAYSEVRPGQNKWNLTARTKWEVKAEYTHVGSTLYLAVHRPLQLLNTSILSSPFISDFLWYVWRVAVSPGHYATLSDPR